MALGVVALDPVDLLAVLVLAVRLQREPATDPRHVALGVLVLHHEAGPEGHVALHVAFLVPHAPARTVARRLELDSRCHVTAPFGCPATTWTAGAGEIFHHRGTVPASRPQVPA